MSIWDPEKCTCWLSFVYQLFHSTLSGIGRGRGRLEPNLPLFFTDFAFWQCSKFLPILPEIMPVFTYFARNYASTCLPILPIKEKLYLK